jgi:hypothetical protein
VSDARGTTHAGGPRSFGTEIEDTSGGRDPYTQFRAVMPTEGLLTDAGLESGKLPGRVSSIRFARGRSMRLLRECPASVPAISLTLLVWFSSFALFIPGRCV